MKTLVLGSVHVNNDEAKKSQKTHEHMQNLPDVADELKCDVLGCDLNMC